MEQALIFRDMCKTSNVSNRERGQATSTSTATNRSEELSRAASSCETDETKDHSSKKKKEEKDSKNNWYNLHPCTALSILVLADMFSVALVVPLLQQYYKDSGIDSISQREMLSSLFSTSQIVGGIVMGFLCDTGLLNRKTILYISFLGSAVSYLMLASGNSRHVIISRAIVGFVKQTMTISTSMLSTLTCTEQADNRLKYAGQLSASATLAFILGPSVGGFLYNHKGKKAPALLASFIFVMNTILAFFVLPNENDDDDVPPPQVPVPVPVDASQSSQSKPSSSSSSSVNKTNEKKSSSSSWSKITSFSNNLKNCFRSKQMTSIVICQLLYHWISRATNYASLPNYYEQMHGILNHQRGYLTSYTSILTLLSQKYFVPHLMLLVGSEALVICFAAAGIGFANVLELKCSFSIYLVIVLPIIAGANAMIRLSLKSTLMKEGQKSNSVGSVFAALDVMQNAASVTVPFYRTALLSSLGDDSSPEAWLQSSCLHWVLSTFVMSALLLKKTDKTTERRKEKLH